VNLDPETADLLKNPRWRPEDLGRPIPDSPHAVSACLPTWSDNVAYEEQDPRVVDRLTTGYPRFVFNKHCRDLFADCAQQFARGLEGCLVFPSQQAAAQCAEFVTPRAAGPVRLHEVGRLGTWCVTFPKTAAASAKSFWQHSGVGVSSRQAAAVRSINNRPAAGGLAAKQTLKLRIAATLGVSPQDVWLFPTGMAAFYILHRALQRVYPDRKLVQFGFPYVDSLKIAQTLGPGAHFFPRGDEQDLQQLAALLATESVCGIATEFPANPLLSVPDLARLQESAHAHGCPLIVDDTVAGSWNVNILPAADAVWCSLTKYFSGRGDVMGGALIMNRSSPFAALLLEALQHDYEDLLWDEDAAVLELNSRNATERVAAIGRNAHQLAEFLHAHPAVERVYYPSLAGRELYDKFRRPHGGYGGLLSIVLRNPAQTTAAFYDRLEVCKGPNLGMNYTLACPFTILAHYNELDFAESCGVSRWLIRVSVGLESPDELIERFRVALSGPA